ncbi:MAG TPA: GvpL/GvpF family gas vesicle protein, partial [Pseudomonadales bacterium]|nr:GvpL/GvpF family gas vesicle protein [Pseudomonadales bacterium]
MAAKRKPAARARRRAARPSRTTRVGGGAGSRVVREAPGAAMSAVEPPVAVKATESRGKYVYCVIRSEDPLRFGAIGLGTTPTEVHTVHYKDIAAVVSDTPIEVLDATRENVLAHERVNEVVMRDHTVIPMSFG